MTISLVANPPGSARPATERAPRSAPHDDPSATGERETFDVSLLVLAVDRLALLDDLIAQYVAPLRESGRTVEVIVALPSHHARAAARLVPLIERGEPIRVVESERQASEAALMRRGLSAASGRTIVTMPAHPRVEPAALVRLVERVEEGVDVAVARRWPRRDPLINRLQHWGIHRLVGTLGAGRVHDLGCGVRAMRRDVPNDVPLYGEFARFFPILALHRGYTVEEVPAAQHPDDLGARVYGPGVYVRRMIDVLGLMFLVRFTDKPLRFFGLIGAVLSAVGFVTLVVMVIDRIQGVALGTRPLLLLAVLCLALGLQAIAFGLIGEMIVHFNSVGRRVYRVREIRERRGP
jgi:glycosyltransferase involved in cell wall biosynthesis